MSDQHDTSRTPTTNKNPLLSASVTGLTFDDFTNKAIILPAAALPPKLLEPKDTEPTKPVIFGNEPAILDTESFSEISLDQPSDQETYPLIANPSQDDQVNTDYTKTFNPLTQATHLTASLSQLPSVASSVFSSFSSILRGNSPTPTPPQHDQQQINVYSATSVPTVGNVPLVNSSLSNLSEQSDVPAVVPTFYSTSDPAFLPPASALSPLPSNSSSSNAYRLTTKRKIYAPAPGLTHQEHQAAPSAPVLPQPINEPNIQVNQSAIYQNTEVSQPPSQNNKFSITSFFATPLLEKITGSSTQGTNTTPDVFANQLTTPAAVNAVIPELLNTSPLLESTPTYPPIQPTESVPSSSAPLFFNPAQQTNLVTSTQSVPNISSIPPSTVPPSGNVVNYRLRGKPHYKNPLSSTSANTPIAVPFPQVTSSPPPAPASVGIFNPVNLSASSDQRIGSIVHPGQSLNPSGFSQPLAQNIDFFSPQQNEPVEPVPFLFDQFNYGNQTSNVESFGKDTYLNQTQQVRSEPVQAQVFQTLPFQLPSEPQQNQPHFVQQQESHYSYDQALFPPSQQPTQLKPNLFEPIIESTQPQNLFQQQPTQQQLQLGTDQQLTPSFQQPLTFANQFDQTSHSQNVEQTSNFYPTQTFSSESTELNQHSRQEDRNVEENIFSKFQPQNETTNVCSTQTFSSEPTELNQISRQEDSNVVESIFPPQHIENILNNTHSQLTNLNISPQESVGETNFFISGQSQQDNSKTEIFNQQKDAATAEPKSSSTFDNFFNRLPTQQASNSTHPEPPPTEHTTTSTLTSSFFATPSNSSPADWFNSPKTVAPSEDQFEDNLNRNTQPIAETGTVDASSFFATTNNNNQISSPPNYFQIQNFFNNPPLISEAKVQDNNFNFIENNLINKRLHNLTHKASTETDGGSISSNIVEPPSSAQSEFSEFAEVNPDTAQGDEYVGEQQFAVVSTNTGNMANTTDQSSDGAIGAEISNVVYRPIYKHWFYNKKSSDQKPTWTPFPMNDSLNLEEAYTSNSNQCITTNGGRYDVSIGTRTRSPIYWNGAEDEVRRCSWFYKGADSRLVPYEESVADLLEEEYRLTSQSGEWNRRIVIPSGEVVMFQAPSIIVHFLAAQTPDIWPNASVPPTANRPRVVKRGVDEFNIEDGEPEQIDHLLFMVHGIGAGCDLKFRSVEEVVEDFRAIALQLTQSHYRSSCDRGAVGRIEVLPVSWHTELHSEESGIDEKLKAITLESIPKLRTFTNDTLLDILFYSSPVFCQKIMDTVAGTINSMYTKYCERNPNFKGNVSLAGHSLGSLILFDLLQNQRVSQCIDSQMDVDCLPASENKDDVAGVRLHKPLSRTRSKKINYTIGPAGTGQPYINYPQLVFHPKKFFALGSPIGMFVTVRGIDTLGLNYKLPTTDGFYNIFHPYDPVAYRIEALVNNEMIPIRPVLIPHHKGRKRMHLELRETMARVGADIKQKIIDTFKSVYNFASLQKNDPKALQQEVDKVLEQQLSLETSHPQRTRACSTSTTSSDDTGETEFSLGILNEGKRIDYVLQEAPLEFFNEYLFALTSHVCYWDSADTILFIVKEIYTSLGMQTDSHIPQQSMTIERPSSTPTSPTPDT